MDANIDLSKLRADVHRTLKSWYKSDTSASSFQDLQLFQQTIEDVHNARLATNKILLKALETLKRNHQDEANILSRHFLDGEKVELIARSTNMGPATVYRRQNDGIDLLADIILNQEMAARAQRQRVLEQRLERPSYTHLIGVEAHLEALLAILTAPGPPWLVSIEGLGGIGKTSLADALSRHLIKQRAFADFGWISARQYDFNPGRGIRPVERPALTVEQLVETLLEQLLPEAARLATSLQDEALMTLAEALKTLRERFQQQPHLIVVDNLETVTDVEILLPALRHLSNPTKFLLTSRESLYHEPGIHHYPLPQLSEADTLHLIRYEIERYHPPHLQNVGNIDLNQIYRVVGGNPLAIRLVIGQTHIFALPTVLDDLIAAQGKKPEMLYTFIYRHAWERLDETARHVLLAMPLVAEGQGHLEHLVEVSGLADANVRDGLDRLVQLNLVDRWGDLQAPTYGIHPLTRTFLQEQVLRWS